VKTALCVVFTYFALTLIGVTVAQAGDSLGWCTHAPTSAVLLRAPITLPLASGAASDNKYSRPDFHLDLVAQPEVPLTISGVEIRNDPGRQLSELKYSLRNESGSKLRAIQILLTFFNERNEPLGGQHLSASPELKSGKNHQFVTSLSHYVDSGQRVAIAIIDFQTETQTWHGDHKVIIDAMKRR
jgi:hypothetical protein